MHIAYAGVFSVMRVMRVWHSQRMQNVRNNGHLELATTARRLGGISFGVHDPNGARAGGGGGGGPNCRSWKSINMHT